MSNLPVTWDDLLAALDDADGHKIDFVDALILQTMSKSKITEIYSNDKDFDRVQWGKILGINQETQPNSCQLMQVFSFAPQRFSWLSHKLSQLHH